jgi:hypothetical protein
VRAFEVTGGRSVAGEVGENKVMALGFQRESRS